MAGVTPPSGAFIPAAPAAWAGFLGIPCPQLLDLSLEMADAHAFSSAISWLALSSLARRWRSRPPRRRSQWLQDGRQLLPGDEAHDHRPAIES
jgi:hypothetical protein